MSGKHNEQTIAQPLPQGAKSAYRTRGFELGLAFAAVLTLYGVSGTAGELWSSWNSQNEEAGYCMLIPAFAIIFVYMKMGALRRAAVRPTFAGLSLIAVGMLLRLSAEFGQVIFIKIVALVFLLAGITWCVFGWRVFKHLAFPFAYLFFMTPLPPFLYRQVAVQMMALATRAGAILMQIAGIEVYRSGNTLNVAKLDVPLNVAEACSGMNSLLVLTAVAVAFAYITKRGLVSRIALSLSAIPIAIGMNMLRIAGVGMLAVYVSQELADGFAHMAQGFLMFVAEMGILFFEGWVIGWILGKPTIETSEEDGNTIRKKVDEKNKNKKRARIPLMVRLGRAYDRFRPWSRDILADYAGRNGRNVFRRMSKSAITVLAVIAVFAAGLHALHASVAERIKPVSLRQPFDRIEIKANAAGEMTSFIVESNFAADGRMRHPYGWEIPRIEGETTFVDKDFIEVRDGYGWIGFVEPVMDRILEVADNDDSLNIRYVAPQHKTKSGGQASEADLRAMDDIDEDKYKWERYIAAYVSYHRSAVDGINKGAVHFPDECYPANGHDRVEEESTYMEVPGYCGGRIEIVRYIYRKKNYNHKGLDQYVMVTYHMNNNGVAVVDRSAGKIDNWLKLVMGKRTGFMAQVQFNTFVGVFPSNFDPHAEPQSDDERQTRARYEDAKTEAWKRIESFGPRFLEKLGSEYLPEPPEE